MNTLYVTNEMVENTINLVWFKGQAELIACWLVGYGKIKAEYTLNGKQGSKVLDLGDKEIVLC